MKKLQKIGGISSFVLAFTYLFGIGFGLGVLNTDGMAPMERLAFHVENYRLFYLWITLVYINAGVFLVPLSLGIKERFDQHSDSEKGLSLLGAAFGIVWGVLVLGSGLVHNTGLLEMVNLYQENPQKALDFWRLIETVHMGIGAEAEIPGGIWSLLVGITGLRTKAFPQWINILGITAGCAGLLTIIPVLMDYIVILYAIGHIVWWIGMGIIMIRENKPER